jgi:ferredoxin--NADP+ reductase
LLEEDPNYQGKIWLFFGVPTTSSLLYRGDLEAWKAEHGDRFRVDYAISREQQTPDGKKMYVQNRMAEYGAELWEMLQKPNTYVYICGLKGMEDGINSVMAAVAQQAGQDWSSFQKELKKASRWNEETY